MSRDGWANIRDASAYAGVSVRTFEEFLADGLPYSMPRRNRLVRFSDIDAYLDRYTKNKSRKAAEIASSMIRGLAGIGAAN